MQLMFEVLYIVKYSKNIGIIFEGENGENEEVYMKQEPLLDFHGKKPIQIVLKEGEKKK